MRFFRTFVLNSYKMAVVKLGALVSDIRGKLGGHIFSKNKSGLYLSTKYKPKQTKSARQSEIRNFYRIVAQLWRNLTEEQRQDWNVQQANFKFVDRWGGSRVYSGFWLFMQLNLNLVNSDQNFVFDVPSLIVSEKDFRIEFIQYKLDNTLIAFGQSMGGLGNMVLKCTKPLALGVQPAKDDYKTVYITGGFTPFGTDITQEYNQLFGSVNRDAQQWAYIKNVFSNGVSITTPPVLIDIET